MCRFVFCNSYSYVSEKQHNGFIRKQLQIQNLFKIPFLVRCFFVKMKTIQSLRGYAWPPSLFNVPRGNRLRARLNFIMIPLKMAERFSITCDHDPSRSTCIKILLIYALHTNSQGKCQLHFIKFILTEKWVGCKHFKSFIFEVFADKPGQVAGDSMTHSCRSSGGSRLLMKALE